MEGRTHNFLGKNASRIWGGRGLRCIQQFVHDLRNHIEHFLPPSKSINANLDYIWEKQTQITWLLLVCKAVALRQWKRLDGERGEECCNGCCHQEMSSPPQSAEPEELEKNFPKSPCCCQGIWGDILCAKHINLGPTVQVHALRVF